MTAKLHLVLLHHVAVMATPDRVIPQRELRNCVGSVLREVESGKRMRVTVRGRAVADIIPLDEEVEPRRFHTIAEVQRLLRETPVDAEFARDIDGAVDQHLDER